MLTSITPLGERSRRQSWCITTIAFVLGGAAGGAAIGALAAGLGSLLLAAVDLSWPARLGLVALAIAVGVALDSRLVGSPLPTIVRQVNENWLHRYRGWVYGLGFGFQLGTGIATVVTTSGVYVLIVAMALSGSAEIATLLGLGFGTLRSATLFAAVRADEPQKLGALSRRLHDLDRPVWAIGLGAQAAAGCLAIVITTTMLS